MMDFDDSLNNEQGPGFVGTKFWITLRGKFSKLLKIFLSVIKESKIIVS